MDGWRCFCFILFVFFVLSDGEKCMANLLTRIPEELKHQQRVRAVYVQSIDQLLIVETFVLQLCLNHTP